MKKRILSFLLGLVLVFCLSAPVAASNTSFSDVSPTAWYSSDVSDVQQYGIIEGVGGNKFIPDGILTYAQAITMAARVYAYLSGDTIDTTLEPEWKWYDPYVLYALDSGLITEADIPMNLNYFDKPCTRQIMADLFYSTISSTYNVAVNDIKSIPDVSDDAAGHAIYSLYRFGILTGNDKYGTFSPERSITRAETAAILNRVLNTEKRKSIYLIEKQLLSVNEAKALVIPVAKAENECYDSLYQCGCVVYDNSIEMVESSETAFVFIIGVTDYFYGDNGYEEGGGFGAVYWISRETGDVRFMLGLQDVYIPGMVDLERGVLNDFDYSELYNEYYGW